MGKTYQRLSQEELDNRINATKAYVYRQEKRQEDSKDSEVDLCYLERENEHRDEGRVLHSAYMNKINQTRKEEEEALREGEFYDA